MVLPKYRVDNIDGQWVIIINKGKRKGQVVKIFNSCEDAWTCYNYEYKNSK